MNSPLTMAKTRELHWNWVFFFLNSAAFPQPQIIKNPSFGYGAIECRWTTQQIHKMRLKICDGNDDDDRGHRNRRCGGGGERKLMEERVRERRKKREVRWVGSFYCCCCWRGHSLWHSQYSLLPFTLPITTRFFYCVCYTCFCFYLGLSIFKGLTLSGLTRVFVLISLEDFSW